MYMYIYMYMYMYIYICICICRCIYIYICSVWALSPLWPGPKMSERTALPKKASRQASPAWRHRRWDPWIVFAKPLEHVDLKP